MTEGYLARWGIPRAVLILCVAVLALPSLIFVVFLVVEWGSKMLPAPVPSSLALPAAWEGTRAAPGAPADAPVVKVRVAADRTAEVWNLPVGGVQDGETGYACFVPSDEGGVILHAKGTWEPDHRGSLILSVDGTQFFIRPTIERMVAVDWGNPRTWYCDGSALNYYTWSSGG